MPGRGVNCVPNSLAFFNHVRTSAAILAGAALSALFLTLPSHSDKIPKRWMHVVTSTHTVLVATTVALELTCVFVATAGGVRVLGGGFDPMAEHVVAFLTREFELDYLIVGLSFFVGLITFVVSLAVRVGASLPGSVGTATVLLLCGTALHMIAFTSASIMSYGGLIHALIRCAQLGVPKVILGTPTGILSMGCFLSAAVVLARGVHNRANGKAD